MAQLICPCHIEHNEFFENKLLVYWGWARYIQTRKPFYNKAGVFPVPSLNDTIFPNSSDIQPFSPTNSEQIWDFVADGGE